MAPLSRRIDSHSPESLILPLTFSTAKSASNLLARNTATWPAQNGAPWGPNDTRLCRIQIADPSPTRWLDLTTFTLSIIIKNTGAGPLKLVGPLRHLFARVRTLCRGAIIDDRYYMGREAEMLYQLQPKERVRDDLNEWPWTAPIPAGQSKRFSWRPFLSLFRIAQLFPIDMAPITLELELCASCGVPASISTATNAAWQLTEISALCDYLDVDAAMSGPIVQQVQSGVPLTLDMVCYSTMMFQIVNAQETYTQQFARSYSRIKAMFITYYSQPRQPPATAGVQIVNSQALPQLPGGFTETDRFTAYQNCVALQPLLDRYDLLNTNTYFQFPAGDQYIPNEFDVQVLFGGNCYPLLPCKGSTQSYFSLRKLMSECWGGDTNIDYDEYRSSKYIFALNMEKSRMGANGADSAWSGANSMGGETFQIIVRGLTTSANAPTQMYVTFAYDAAVEIAASGCELQI